jgi:CII-binding regulator of phage lambda lysogenization HflD
VIAIPTSADGANFGGTAGSAGLSLLSGGTRSGVDCELQKIMYVALELLRILRRSDRDPQQARQIQAEIIALARWMEFLTAQREHMLAVEQAPDLVKLSARPVCDRCRKRPQNNPGRSAPRLGSAPAPIWKTQLGFLLACIQRVGLELLAKLCASDSLRNFQDCLARLMQPLLQLQHSLAGTEVAETSIEVEHSSHTGCALCGGPLELASETS